MEPGIVAFAQQYQSYFHADSHSPNVQTSSHSCIPNIVANATVKLPPIIGMLMDPNVKTKKRKISTKKRKRKKSSKKPKWTRAGPDTSINDSDVVGIYDMKQCAADFPVGSKYNVILADFPWNYAGCNNKNYWGPPYPPMSMADAKKIKISEIASDDCALLMWVTGARLPYAIELYRVWGFDYKTVFLTWVKCYRGGKPITGLGHYSRSCTEFLLIGTKGDALGFKQSKFVSQLLGVEAKEICVESLPEFAGHSERTGHSVKPDLAFDCLEEFFGDKTKTRKIELFARRIRTGWSSWGLELTQKADGTCIYFHED